MQGGGASPWTASGHCHRLHRPHALAPSILPLSATSSAGNTLGAELQSCVHWQTESACARAGDLKNFVAFAESSRVGRATKDDAVDSCITEHEADLKIGVELKRTNTQTVNCVCKSSPF